jgi:ubiquinone/menaquinone biosynthesis C-methylase UbiE
VGTGLGDHLVPLITTGQRYKTRVLTTGIDLNPQTVGYGRAWLDRTLPHSLRSQIQVRIANALQLPYAPNSFDVVHAALFLHHFHGPEAVQLLREMDRVSRLGIVVNDLHRHPIAYAGIWGLTRLLPVSPMVRHDGPLSVRRGFRRYELTTLFQTGGLSHPVIRWHWPFRWTCSTLPV